MDKDAQANPLERAAGSKAFCMRKMPVHFSWLSCMGEYGMRLA